MYNEARYFILKENRIVCQLCPHTCVLSPGQTGRCQQRKNIAGRLIAEGYAQCSSIALDPMEKKPLYHFYPGSQVLSVGSYGCNLTCLYCQNWCISQQIPPTREVSPQELVSTCQDLQTEDDRVSGIAFTYSEPGIWYEYVADTATLARSKGLKTVMVTNGYLNPAPFAELCHCIEAFNIDVKSFGEAFYHRITGGELGVVKQNVETAAATSHVEVTYLVVPEHNDDTGAVRQLAEWLVAISPNIPLHLSRYFPNYKMQLPPTPVETMLELYQSASEVLPYVYLGNMHTTYGRDTMCPGCGELLLRRTHSQVETLGLLPDGTCNNCGRNISIKQE